MKFILRDKLSQTQELCPNLPEEVNLLTSYMVSIANYTLSPIGLASCLSIALADIKEGVNSRTKRKLPVKLLRRKEKIIDSALYIPQLVDILADQEFSSNFKNALNLMVNLHLEENTSELPTDTVQYSPYIDIAVHWWADAILPPELDDILLHKCPLPPAHIRRYSQNEIIRFKNVLAKEISILLNKYNQCCLFISDYPCHYLKKAGDIIGINPITGYPHNLMMKISYQQITVSIGINSPIQTLWEKEKK